MPMLEAVRRRIGIASADSIERAEGRRREHETWTIEPIRVGVVARTVELWRYRRIIWFLARQAVKDRYSGTTLGAAWLFIRPLAPLFIGAVIFGRFLNVPSQGVPYFLFFLAGSSCWRVFERTLLWVTRSLDQHRGLLKKVYFPRLAAPIASATPAVVEFGIFLALMLFACAYYFWKDGVFYLRVGWPSLVGLLAGLLAILFALSVSLFTTVMQVKHRDVQYTVRYMTQVWMYITPVIYPLEHVPDRYRWLISLNPMAAIVEAFKWGMIGVGAPPGVPFAYSVFATLAVTSVGVWFFTRSEAGSIDRL
jgi:lipopolysaccharide transport system permease protein